jgi:hypothetical protein
MSSNSMLIHAGARLLRRPRLARTPCPFVHVVCGWLVATKAGSVGSSYSNEKPEKAARS